MPVESSEDEFSDDDLEFVNDIPNLRATGEKQIKSSQPTVVKRPKISYQMTLDGKRVEYGCNRNAGKKILYNPTHHQLNYDNLATYIYPTNFEIRDYQFSIVRNALFENVLCALPTGLGKTFIASTVMLNFFRWTSEGKIIFVAPTRPLVSQQIKACYGITGIPPEETAILLDKTKRNRAEIWSSKRVFFATPQVVENDLSSGLLDPKEVVCLVVDEAHRAKGNYSYTNIVKFLNRFTSSFRVLALSATPSADIEGIQQIVNNLNISRIEIRTESDPDTAKYIKTKNVEKIDCDPNNEMLLIAELIADAISPVLQKANAANIYEITDPTKINHFQAMERSQKIIRDPTLAEGIKWSYYFSLQLLGTVGQFYRRLHIYGIKTFFSYFMEKYTEFTTKYDNKKSTNKTAASFFYHYKIKKLKSFCEEIIKNDEQNANEGKVIQGVFSHPKLEYLIGEMTLFLDNPDAGDSKVIIFTEFRESALEIVKTIEAANKTIQSSHTNGHAHLLRPHIFIGQAKEKDKFDKEKYEKSIKPKPRKSKAPKEAPVLEQPTAKRSRKERPSDRVGSSEDAQTKGMNQAFQKQLIKDFKSGIYNILVATSIGEEGLDIGEVDLIVCYDSTSSPIKNIQRMGRTGRKRDGRILLLFSSNERSKFDKAMDNYSWIQNQIQNGDQIELRNCERIIPQEYTPIAEKIMIDIPEENEEIVHKTEDYDEFLKLATQLTTKKGKSGKLPAKKGLKQQKLEKRFFMPDNVETGFTNASHLLNKSNTTEGSMATDSGISNSHITRKRGLDEVEVSDLSDLEEFSASQILGISRSSIDVEPKVDHSSHSCSVKPDKSLETKMVSQSSLKSNGTDRSIIDSISGLDRPVIQLDDSEDDLEILKDEENVFIKSKRVSPALPSVQKGVSEANKILPAIISKSNDVINSQPPNSDDEDNEFSSDDEEFLKFIDEIAPPTKIESSTTNEKHSATNLVASEAKGDIESPLSLSLNTTIDDDSHLIKSLQKKLADSKASSKQNEVEKQLKKKSKKVQKTQTGPSILSQLKNMTPSDPVFADKFQLDDGFLTEEQQKEFFSKYFVDINDADKFNLAKVDNPAIALRKGYINGKIPHSVNSSSFIEAMAIFENNKEVNKDGKFLSRTEMLHEEMTNYYNQSLVYRFNDDYRIQDRIAEDDESDQ